MQSYNKKKISLVLGGGGTKGFIHIGVLRYLEENNYTIQEITGTSVGALIGALIAYGYTSKQIIELFRTFDTKDIIDIDRKNASIKGQKIINALINVFDTTNIEDLPMPYKAIVTNLDDGTEIVYDRGPIIDAIRYSISIPGVFSLHDEEKPYVDGGVVNNLPINHLTHQDNIIASSCMGYEAFDPQRKIQLYNINIPNNRISRKINILMRSLLVMIKNMEDTIIQNYPHTIVIRPVAEDIDPYNMKNLDKTIQRGYNETIKILG